MARGLLAASLSVPCLAAPIVQNGDFEDGPLLSDHTNGGLLGGTSTAYDLSPLSASFGDPLHPAPFLHAENGHHGAVVTGGTPKSGGRFLWLRDNQDFIGLNLTGLETGKSYEVSFWAAALAGPLGNGMPLSTPAIEFYSDTWSFQSNPLSATGGAPRVELSAPLRASADIDSLQWVKASMRFAVPVGVTSGQLFVGASDGSGQIVGRGMALDLLTLSEVSNSGAIGNLVFRDQNQNGTFEAAGDQGLDDVEIHLHPASAVIGQTPPLSTLFTRAGGLYLFSGLPEGEYFLHLPPSNFAPGGALFGHRSHPGGGGDNGADDDADENGQDNPLFMTEGIRSANVTIEFGQEPTETGHENGGDDANERNIDLTVDFAFRPFTTGAGNLVFFDRDRNGRFTSGYDYGVGGVTVRLFPRDAPTSTTPARFAITDALGRYLLSNIPPGDYFVHIPATQFRAGGPLAGYFSSSGAGGDAQADDDLDENGLDSTSPTTSGVSSGVIQVTEGGEPINEAGVDGTSDSPDADVDLTVDFGFHSLQAYDVGGRVVGFGDAPRANLTVQLYGDLGCDGQIDPGDPLLDTDVTNAGGGFLFTDLPKGCYLIRKLDSAQGAVVSATTSADSVLSVNLDNADSTANDFADPIDPAGHFYSRKTGRIIFGGSISVSGPPGANIVIDQPTDDGKYSWVTDLPGLYTMTVTPPPDWSLSLPDPSPDPLDPTGQANPLSLGSGEDPGNPGYMANFTAAANPWRVTFQLEPGDPLVINNNVPLTRNKPENFADWASRLGPLLPPGQSGASANPDTDVYPNLLEYALCLPPGSGLKDKTTFCVERNATGGVDLVFGRIKGGADDLTFRLQKLGTQLPADLSGYDQSANWSDILVFGPGATLPVAPPPASLLITDNNNGTEDVRVRNADQIPGLSRSFGVARLLVEAGGNGSAALQAHGWQQVTVAQQCESIGFPYETKEVFSGVVEGLVSGSVTRLSLAAAVGSRSLSEVISPNVEYYLEVVSPPALEGHRFDIDTAGTRAAPGQELVLKASSSRHTVSPIPNLTGASIIARPHLVINDLYTRTWNPTLRANGDPGQADNLLLFSNSIFTTYFFIESGASFQWTDAGSPANEDAGAVVISPNAGHFFHRRDAAITFLQVGAIRETAFRCPPPAGEYALLAGGWPLDQSPASRSMTTANGFFGSLDPTTADSLQVWMADGNPGQSRYQGYFLLNGTVAGTPRNHWTNAASAALSNENTTSLFRRGRCAFLRSRDGAPNWFIKPPWRP